MYSLLPVTRSTAQARLSNCFSTGPFYTCALLSVVGVSIFVLMAPRTSVGPCSGVTSQWPARARAVCTRAKQRGGLRQEISVMAATAWVTTTTLPTAPKVPPPVPTRGYIISMQPNSTRYKQSVEAIQAAGVKELVRVEGMYIDKRRFAHGTHKQQDTLKLGLTRSHMRVWQQLIDDDVEAAWVFEDDVVFHDDWDVLFPQYWAKVPSDYDFVWVGSCAACGPEVQNDTVVTAPPCFPWCIHAYILTRGIAERLILNAEYKFARATENRLVPKDMPHENFTTLWYLDEYDISADNLIGSQYRWLTPTADKHKWVVFRNTEAVPAQWMGVTWTMGHWYASECQCWCDAPDRQRCIETGSVPVYPAQHGLAYQQSCSKLEDPEALSNWQDEVVAYKAKQELSELRTTCHGWPR